jgi:hypothetical protein
VRDLQNNTVDYTTSALKGVAGGIPLVGGVVAELVGSIIPNQRVDRIVKFLEILDQKLLELGEDVARTKLALPAATSLVEEGILSAYRAYSEERQAYIASVIKNGIKPKNMPLLEARRVLSVLDQLNDAEVVLLLAYGSGRLPYEGNIPTLVDSKERRESYAIRQSYHDHLEQLGLIAAKIEMTENTWERQEIGKGTPEITPFGKAVISFIDGHQR